MSAFHPIAWFVWAVAAGVAALLTRNPLYLTLIALAAGVVWTAQRHAAQTPLVAGRGLARLALTALTFSVVLNMLFSHSGRTVLIRLPAVLPYIGGPITLEAAVYGLTTGLAILALLLVALAFNAAVDPAQMLRYLPGFLYSAGLVVSIALTFAPQTKRALDEIREAQQVRGHRPRGLRDLPPLVVPLVTTGLENAIGLAEAMAARGFGHTAPQSAAQPRSRMGAALAALGLFPDRLRLSANSGAPCAEPRRDQRLSPGHPAVVDWARGAAQPLSPAALAQC
jgi:energy-coupling factor transport system permease protein